MYYELHTEQKNIKSAHPGSEWYRQQTPLLQCRCECRPVLILNSRGSTCVYRGKSVACGVVPARAIQRSRHFPCNSTAEKPHARHFVGFAKGF